MVGASEAEFAKLTALECHHLLPTKEWNRNKEILVLELGNDSKLKAKNIKNNFTIVHKGCMITMQTNFVKGTSSYPNKGACQHCV